MKDKKSLYKVLKFSFETLDTIFEYKKNVQRNDIIAEVFDQVTLIFNREEDFERGIKLIRETDCINTTADANMINLEELDSLDIQMALEIKSSILINRNINQPRTFQNEDFIEKLYNGTLEGNKNNCMLLAIISWFGIGLDVDRNKALKLWKILAYNGSIDAMDCLIYAYKQEEKYEEMTMWQKVKELYVKTKQEIIIALSNNEKEKKEKEIIEIVEKILCVWNRNIQLKKQKRMDEDLDFAMLYYVSTSIDDHNKIINNICNLESDGYKELLISNHFESKKYIF